MTETFKRKWVNDFPLADLTFEALKDIAVNRRVKQIFSVSNDWIRLLEKNKVPLEREVILKKHGGKSYSFAFRMYRISDGALPILFCDLKGSPINLPRNPLAVQVARSLLGVSMEPIPTTHPEFEITIL